MYSLIVYIKYLLNFSLSDDKTGIGNIMYIIYIGLTNIVVARKENYMIFFSINYLFINIAIHGPYKNDSRRAVYLICLVCGEKCECIPNFKASPSLVPLYLFLF